MRPIFCKKAGEGGKGEAAWKEVMMRVWPPVRISAAIAHVSKIHLSLVWNSGFNLGFRPTTVDLNHASAATAHLPKLFFHEQHRSLTDHAGNISCGKQMPKLQLQGKWQTHP